LDTALDKLYRKRSGRRSRTHTDRKRGRYIQARPSQGKADDLAFDATLRAAAPFQRERGEQRKRVAFAIQPSDYQRKVRVKKTANLVLFVVDASWSMAVAERMSATKGAILSLLTDAYQRRDRVGLVVFQKDRATLILPPTNSVMLAQRALADIPVGGKTPLSAGLFMTYQVLQREKILHPDVQPLVILLTDGAGNVSMTTTPPQDEAHRLAEQIAIEKVRSVVINMEHAAFDQGLAQALAEHLKAPCYTLQELKAETLYRTVREEMDTGRGL
jgi:magnesium chelatase subunit D